MRPGNGRTAGARPAERRPSRDGQKKRIEDLAWFGGAPLFESIRPIGQLALPDEKLFFDGLRSIYRSRRLTNNGPLAQELERRLAELHQVPYCVAYANASLAIVALLEIVAGGRRGEVIMPAFTYVGLPHIAQWAGQRPRFCDVDRATHTLDPRAVAAALGSDTTAVLAVHQVNSPCHIDELTAACSARGVPLVFDSVHGIHCTYRGRPIGGFGIAEVFSLHATKLLNGFEGGYVTTHDGALASALKTSRNFGIVGEAEVSGLGFNAKLNEIHAAGALASLPGQPQIVERNLARVHAYRERFAGIPGLSWVPYPEGERSSYEFALLEVEASWPLGRDLLVDLMLRENARGRPYYSPPLHRSAHCPDFIDPPSLPVTEDLSLRFIQMPVGELVSLDDIALLGDWFAFVHEHGAEIAARLEAK
jgi:dTDP-4-amino-4,6-dideoxyglucose